MPLEQSLSHLLHRIPTQSTTLVVSAMRIASETGGGLAETLERTAHTIRHRLQMEGKIRALTAQGKLQAWVVSLLPVLLMLVLDRMEPEAMHYLWHTRLGWVTLAGIGQSLVAHIGGDTVIGRNPHEYLGALAHEPATEAVLYCGEIGGDPLPRRRRISSS